MENSLFRKKNMERLNSPEELNDYIKVCNPPLWIVLAAVILFLAGALVWCLCGQLDTTLNTALVSEGGKATVYVKAADMEAVRGKTISINGEEYAITEAMCSQKPVSANSDMPEYALYLAQIAQGEWVYTITLFPKLPDGIYEAKIVTDSVSPINFILN